MIGWVIFALLVLASWVLLWLLRFPKGLWAFVVASAMLAAAGYVAQGRPGLEGHPVQADAEPLVPNSDLVAMREAMFGRFNLEDSYFRIADSMLRSGSRASAVKALLGATNRYPDDYALWTMLGVAFAEHDNNLLSPAATQAFRRGIRLAPNHPGPYYFFGVAYVRAGELEQGRAYWAKALELTGEKMSYRPVLVDQIASLDRYIALRAAMGQQGGATPRP